MTKPTRQGTEIAKNDERKSGPNEQKGKEKVTVVTQKQDIRKPLPRKLAKDTSRDVIIEFAMKHVGLRGELTETEATKKIVEMEAKEESTENHRAQKQVTKEKDIKGKGII